MEWDPVERVEISATVLRETYTFVRYSLALLRRFRNNINALVILGEGISESLNQALIQSGETEHQQHHQEDVP